MAFLELKNNPIIAFDSELITNLLIIGDSPHEVMAGKSLANSLPRCIIKIFKNSLPLISFPIYQGHKLIQN